LCSARTSSCTIFLIRPGPSRCTSPGRQLGQRVGDPAAQYDLELKARLVRDTLGGQPQREAAHQPEQRPA
jgi:hypothetical protein